MTLIRMLLVVLAGSTVAYLLVSVYSRSVRTERLEKRWDREQPEGISREDYVAAGLKHYDSSFRKKLILLIYVVPVVAVIASIWVRNYMGYR